MQIYGWELLAFCHHLDKSCDHSRCASGDMFLTLSQDPNWPRLKGYVNLWVVNLEVTTLPCLVAIGLVQMKI